MSSREKQKIFELLKDPILRPHGYDGMLIPNDYIRAKWSLHPFYRGLHRYGLRSLRLNINKVLTET